MNTDPVQPSWDHYMSRLVSLGSVYCRWARNLDGYQRKAHRHDGIEIVYCEYGDGTFHVAGTDHVLTNGVLLVFPATLPHFPFMRRRYERWMLCFHPAAVNGSTSITSLQPIVHHHIGSQDQRRVKRIFQEIEHEVTSRKAEAERFINLLLEQLSIIVRRNETQGGTVRLAPDRFQQSDILPAILSYIEAHLHDAQLSVEHLAETFHYAPGHIWRIIRTATGHPPVQYINGRRLINACKLLTDTVRPVSVVADMTGFSSASYFARVFRQEMGCTPKEYRDRVSSPS